MSSRSVISSAASAIGAAAASDIRSAVADDLMCVLCCLSVVIVNPLKNYYRSCPIHSDCYNAVRSKRRLLSQQQKDEEIQLFETNKPAWREGMKPFIGSPEERRSAIMSQKKITILNEDNEGTLVERTDMTKKEFKTHMQKKDDIDSDTCIEEFNRLWKISDRKKDSAGRKVLDIEIGKKKQVWSGKRKQAEEVDSSDNGHRWGKPGKRPLSDDGRLW